MAARILRRARPLVSPGRETRREATYWRGNSVAQIRMIQPGEDGQSRARRSADETDRGAQVKIARDTIAARYPPLDQLFEGSRAIVIAAAARMGHAFLRALRRERVAPAAFADNDATKWGTAIDGVPVMAPRDAFARHPDAAVCVASLIAESELTEQMRELGFPIVYPLSVLHYYRPDVFVAPYLDGAFETSFDPTHAEGIAAVGALWSDAESVTTYQGILEARRTISLESYSAIRAHHPQYFPPGLVRLTDRDIICDGGAFTGDTLESYRAAFPNLRIPYYGFEPDPVNYSRLVAAGKDYSGPFFPIQAGLGASKMEMTFATTGGMDGSFSADAPGSPGPAIHVETIDGYFLNRPPTFIKMDIEAMEPDALAGAERTIREHGPTLAICVYHRPTHLWEIPKWVHERNSSYRFYLRHYSTNMSETVMYAIQR